MRHLRNPVGRAFRLFLIGCACLLIPAVPALASSSVSGSASVEGYGSISAVDISLRYGILDEAATIVPGQVVSLRSEVENHAETAWIRVKISYPAQDDTIFGHLGDMDLTELDDSLITFASTDWRKIGPYYYWLQPVQAGTAVPFTEAITFPADWDNRMVDDGFGIAMTAEAVQSRNFNPDFDSEDPWFGTVIEAFDSTMQQPPGAGNEKFQVVYEGGAEGMVHAEEDFFSKWLSLVPGSTITGKAEIRNSMELPVKIQFGMKSRADNGILEQLHLKIRNGDTIVYDDDLETGIDPRIVLAEYQPGDVSAFSYELSVPPEMDNAYAMSDFQVIWTFFAEERQEEAKPWIPALPDIPTGDVRLYGIAGGILLCGALGLYGIRKGGRRR